MADYWGSHHGPVIGATGHTTTRNTTQRAIASGLGHSRKRWKGMHMVVPSGQDLASGEIYRLIDIASSDRLIEIKTSMDANWGATTDFNIGLYKKGKADDGVVVDVDLFGAAVDWSGAIARVDQFTVGALDDWDRGKLLWELANIGLAASTYDAETNEMWTIALTASSNNSAAAAAVEFLIELDYVSGD